MFIHVAGYVHPEVCHVLLLISRQAKDSLPHNDATCTSITLLLHADNGIAMQGDSQEGGAAASVGCSKSQQIPLCLWH